MTNNSSENIQAYRLQVANNINRLLEIQGISSHWERCKFLKQEFKISLQAASKWLQGHSLPDPSKYQDLCQILKCGYEELLGDALSYAPTQKKPSANIPLDINGLHLATLLNFDFREGFIMAIADNSMAPALMDGDILFAQKTSSIDSIGIYVFTTTTKGDLKYIIRDVTYLEENILSVTTRTNSAAAMQIKLTREKTLPANSKLKIFGKLVGRLLNGR